MPYYELAADLQSQVSHLSILISLLIFSCLNITPPSTSSHGVRRTPAFLKYAFLVKRLPIPEIQHFFPSSKIGGFVIIVRL